MSVLDNENIMIVDKCKNDIMFRLGCACGSEKCDMTVTIYRWVLKDDPSNMCFIEMSFYKTIEAYDYYGNGRKNQKLLSRFWWRIKTALRILFIGNVRMESELSFRDEKHIQSFINTLNESIEYIRGGK